MRTRYTTALRLGTAETESILRRFTRNNVQHPTYKAFAELGKAIKTIFLCQYLHREELRREINEGLNVIEQWHQFSVRRAVHDAFAQYAQSLYAERGIDCRANVTPSYDSSPGQVRRLPEWARLRACRIM